MVTDLGYEVLRHDLIHLPGEEVIVLHLLDDSRPLRFREPQNIASKHGTQLLGDLIVVIGLEKASAPRTHDVGCVALRRKVRYWVTFELVKRSSGDGEDEVVVLIILFEVWIGHD